MLEHLDSRRHARPSTTMKDGETGLNIIIITIYMLHHAHVLAQRLQVKARRSMPVPRTALISSSRAPAVTRLTSSMSNHIEDVWNDLECPERAGARRCS